MVTAWGTTSSALTQVILYYFNPRSRVGNDHRPLPGFLFCRNFNPRSRVGNDKRDFGIVIDWENFNPRSRVGNDDAYKLSNLPFYNFNPRSRVGNDFPCSTSSPDIVISIHVPAWGTTNQIILIPTFMIFQSTFPRGERRFSS